MRLFEAQHYRVFGASDALGNPAVLYRVDSLYETHSLIEAASQHPGIDVGFYCADGTDVEVRWFNDNNEIQFCGHAALALAWQMRETPGHFSCAAFDYSSVELNGAIALQLPVLSPQVMEQAPVDLDPLELNFEHVFYEPETRILLLRCPDAASIDAWQPQFDVLARWPSENVGALLLFAPADQHYDGYLRYFAPWYGKHEDNATGSAMRVLISLLEPGENQGVLDIRQLSAGGGVLHIARAPFNQMLVTGAVEQLQAEG